MEDEDLELFDTKRRFKKWYIFDVFERYGFAYGMIALVTFLCHVIIFLPAAAYFGYKSIEKAINFLSRGDKVIADCFWAYLVVSLVAIVSIWATNKICDKVLYRNKSIAK
jgi:hypothetical protein